MSRHNFVDNAVAFPLFTTGSLALTAGAGAVNGAAVSNVNQIGREIVFAIQMPTTLTGVTAFSARVEGSNDGSTWAPLKQNDGTTDLAFTGAAFIAAGAYAGKTVVGSFPAARAKYKHFRLGNITVTGASIVIGGMAIVANLYTKPPVVPNVDEFLTKFLPTGVP